MAVSKGGAIYVSDGNCESSFLTLLPDVSFVTLVNRNILCLFTTVLIRVQLSTEDY